MDIIIGKCFELHMTLGAIVTLGLWSSTLLALASFTQCFTVYQKEKP